MAAETLYTTVESNQLNLLNTTYTNLLSQYASAKAIADGYVNEQVLHPNSLSFATATNQAVSTASNLLAACASAKINLDDYREFLQTKYTQTFNASNPEVVVQLAQVASETQIGVTTAQGKSDIEIAQANSELEAKAASAKTTKIVVIVAVSVLGLIAGFWAFKKFVSKNPE